MYNGEKFFLLGILIAVVFFTNRHRPVSVSVAGPGAVSDSLSASVSSVFVPLPDEEGRTPTPEAIVNSGSVAREAAFYREELDEPPTFETKSILVADLKTKEAYLDLESGKRWPIASITKLMTAAVAFEHLPQDQAITIDSSDISPEVSVAVLGAGERYSAYHLIQAMLLASSNEAAEALAGAYGREEFLLAMNAQAKAWGLSETFFSDPTGLSASNQSTAADLLKLTAKIYEVYPEIFEITSQTEAVVRELGTGLAKTMKSINAFAGQENFLGGKTGFTDEARGNLLSLFIDEGRPVAAIVLGTEDRFGETAKAMRWFRKSFTTGR